MGDITTLDELVAAVKTMGGDVDKNVITAKYDEALKAISDVAAPNTSDEDKQARARRATYAHFHKILDKLSKAKKVTILIAGFANKRDNRKKLATAMAMFKNSPEEAYKAYPNQLFDKEGHLMWKAGKYSELPQLENETINSSGVGIILDGNGNYTTPIVFSANGGVVVDKLFTCNEGGIYDVLITPESLKMNPDGITEGKALEFIPTGKSVEPKTLLNILAEKLPDKFKVMPDDFDKVMKETAKKQFSLLNGLVLVDCAMMSIRPNNAGNYAALIMNPGTDGIPEGAGVYDCTIPERAKPLEKFGDNSEVYAFGSVFKGTQDDKPRLTVWFVIPHPTNALPPQQTSAQPIEPKQIFPQDPIPAGDEEEMSGDDVNA